LVENAVNEANNNTQVKIAKILFIFICFVN
jgi:hypothetical protein